ncbi:MAG TPA: MMPL family transporter [Dehalococcoidia bacterium]|nr:MMPL family transporter [Dehalococcoidia bacterium]
MTIGVWFVLLLVAGFLTMNLLGDALTTDADVTTNPQSKQARKLIEDRLRGPQRVNEIVIVQSESATVEDLAFRGIVEGLYQDITALGPEVVASGTSYYQSGDETLVSDDRHTTILPFAMAGSFEDANDNIDQVLDVVDSAEVEGFGLSIAGNASMGKDFEEAAQSDLQTGEAFGIPIALIILVGVFGAIAASVVPVVLALLSIALAIGASALIGQRFELSFFVTNVITMIGLAVGIDYSLFIISRYREERQRGLDKLEAIARAGTTAGRTVFFSGITVIIALLGMLIVPQTIFRSIAVGTVLVAVIAVAASLTLLPAVLSLLGDRVNWGRIPLIQRGQAVFDEQRPGGFWDRLARTIMRHPVVSFVAAAGLLIAAAIPYFSINAGFSGVSTLPDSLPAKQAFLTLDREFSAGLISPAHVVIDGQVNSPQVQEGVQRLESILAGDPAFGNPTYEANAAGDLALVEVPVAGDPNSNQAEDAVQRLRGDYVPQAFGGVPARVLVGGDIAANLDGFDMLERYTPIVFAFVLGLSFILLLVVFRSIVVPIKAVIMNLLSVGAAYGLLVLVTQEGVGAGLFGFQQVESIEAWLPIFLFAILFGLSMDYHVFLLSRIRERYDQTHDNTEAVVFGVRSTGRLITGAALIMVAVFGGFAAGDLVMFQEMGFGAGVAVLLDATIVRSILVPASMRLLGDWNWYLPKVLQWLPDMRVEAPERVQRRAT